VITKINKERLIKTTVKYIKTGQNGKLKNINKKMKIWRTNP